MRIARSPHQVMSMLAAGLVAAACGSADSAPPVASIEVKVNKTSVALGSPLDLTYRFVVAPDASIDGDYRVFLHLNRDDGTTIWTDDHEFPDDLRTSSWTPGQVIEYTRTRFMPSFSYLGPATLVAGLYKDDVRLPLSGPEEAGRETAGRAYVVGRINLLPRSDNIQVIRLSGWHSGEFAPDDPTREWQWTQKLATLSLRNPRTDLVLFLEFDARPDLFPGAPQQVTVYAGDRPMAVFEATNDQPRLERIPISAADLGSADMAEIRIGVDRTFVPAEVPGGGQDARELGIRVFHAHIEPR